MGVGKTSVGRQLAGLLHRPFVDVDAEIESRCGADIQWIFDMEGEAGFPQKRN
jgi:shikimate kinase